MRRRVLDNQPTLFAEDQTHKNATSSTFSDNLSLPIHRWFRYSAGFSALWVRELIEQEKANGRTHILDPFLGSGTVILEAELCDTEAIGIEAHPFIARIAEAKLHWRTNPAEFHDYAINILKTAKNIHVPKRAYPPLIKKCYPAESLVRLDSLRAALDAQDSKSPYYPLAWLTLVAILRDCSPVGTAQWQYVLPRKTKARRTIPMMPSPRWPASSAATWNGGINSLPVHQALVHQEDARQCRSVPDGWADLVITSPPYANNYDYADATRLEMTFFGEVNGWAGLQDTVRKHLIRSCTQHVARISKETDDILQQPALSPIKKEIIEVCRRLNVEKDSHGGKKPYYTMIATYFKDLAEVWIALRRATAAGCLVCFVIGDSAPYGIYVPVERLARRTGSGSRVQILRVRKDPRPQRQVEEPQASRAAA